MSTTSIYNLIILDESGSMNIIRQNALSSINETLQSIRSTQKEHPEILQYVTIITFSGSGMEGVKTRRDRVPVENIRDLTLNDYMPDNCTPLYDAIGMGVTNLRENIRKEDKVLVTIITDGMENTSHKFSLNDIKNLVSLQREEGWTFSFIGANQDSVMTARKMDIENALNFSCTPQGVAHMCLKMKDAHIKFSKFIAENAQCPSACGDLKGLFDDEED